MLCYDYKTAKMNNFLSNAELKLETDLTTHSLLSVPEEEEAPIPFPMDKIQHHFMEVRGLKHHVAEIGTGNRSSHRRFLAGTC